MTTRQNTSSATRSATRPADRPATRGPADSRPARAEIDTTRPPARGQQTAESRARSCAMASAPPAELSRENAPPQSGPHVYANAPLHGPAHANARRRARRLLRAGTLTELISGRFAQTQDWARHSLDRKILEKILAVTQVHPHWALASISAAAVYGYVARAGLHSRVHCTADEHTASARRSVVPVCFHHVKGGRLRSGEGDDPRAEEPQPRSQTLLNAFGERGYEDSQDVVRNYVALSDTLGLLFGILVTSPLQTMFDCARMLPFSDALPACDYIARVFCISRDAIREFLDKRRGCWKIRYARFVLGFVDARSESGGESFCRARMIESGFVLPELQQSMANPLSAPEFITTARYTTMTMRTDFMWKGTKTIVAEFDGQCKYTDPTMITSVGASDGDEVHEIQAERDTALTMMGCEVVHVTYADVRYNSGRSLSRKLRAAGVPEVSYWEKYRRKHWLARSFHARSLMRLE
ncbi:hypothetical protein [Alloscardovia macacae]|nr:hypothetical protein [Alloscardovia macacae]